MMSINVFWPGLITTPLHLTSPGVSLWTSIFRASADWDEAAMTASMSIATRATDLKEGAIAAGYAAEGTESEEQLCKGALLGR
jgi:hypothetical protein